ncbi:MAG: TolB family protein, partial [Bacteroidia bacterium]
MKKLFLLSLIPFFAMAQNNLNVETLWQMGRISEHSVSPNGELAIYAVKNYDLKANKGTNIIYTQGINNGKPTAISNAEQNAFGARFTPDGKLISFLSAKSGEVQLYTCQLDGSKAEQITFAKGGINGYKFSPTMKHVALVMDVKLDQEVKEKYPDLDKSNARIIDGLFYRHWDAWHDYAYSHLFIQEYNNGKLMGEPKDLMLGEKFDCPVPPHGDDDEFNWSPDGSKIAYDSKKLHG